MDMASTLSAVAATLAAVLAGLNLIVSGKREDRRWVRDTATEALVAYVHASFETWSACKKIVALRESGTDDVPEDLKRRIDDAHDIQMQNLTRLRLLSTPEVVTAAHRLHDTGDEIVALAFGDGDDWHLEKARERLWLARSQMFTAGRRAIRVRNPAGTSLELS